MRQKQITDFSAVTVVADDGFAITTNGVFSLSTSTGKLFYGNGSIAVEVAIFTNIDKLAFNTGIANPTYSEGLLFYDQDKKALSYYNDESDVTVNLGQELLIKVCNDTGSLIPNGTVLYPTGWSIPNSCYTVGLADAHFKDKSRLVAIATHDIEDGTTGYVTRLGDVSGLNTSAYNSGDVIYLSATTPGAFTTVSPDDGSYEIVLGIIGKSDATTGTLVVDVKSSSLTVEVTDTNGFPTDQRTSTTLAVDNGTRTFSITPTGDEFHFYQLGKKYEKDAVDSVVFDDIEGDVAIYYDGGVLSFQHNPTPAQYKDYVLNKCFVAEFHWNATDNQVELDIFDERHGISMSPNTHLYLHTTRGAQYLSGYTLGNFVADASGNTDTHSQFSVTEGSFVDEDIDHNYAGISVGGTIPVTYLSGADGYLRSDSQTGYSFLNAPAGRLYYNQFTGGAWQLTEVANNSFVLYHLFTVNGINETLVSVMGQNTYTNITNARNAAATEISNILSTLDMQETIPVATILLQARDTLVTSSGATWSRVTTVVTVTSANHGLITGDTITVTAIDGSQTTGAKTITVIDSNTFTFSGVNSGASTGTITYTVPAFTNATKSRIRTISTGVNYVNWLTTELAQGATPASHSNLTNVLFAGLGVSQGHINNLAQTIYGVKTFDSSPIVPEPTTDSQVATKKYVDDNSGGLTETEVKKIARKQAIIFG